MSLLYIHFFECRCIFTYHLHFATYRWIYWKSRPDYSFNNEKCIFKTWQNFVKCLTDRVKFWLVAFFFWDLLKHRWFFLVKLWSCRGFIYKCHKKTNRDINPWAKGCIKCLHIVYSLCRSTFYVHVMFLFSWSICNLIFGRFIQNTIGLDHRALAQDIPTLCQQLLIGFVMTASRFIHCSRKTVIGYTGITKLIYHTQFDRWW